MSNLNEQRMALMRRKLTQALAPSHLEIIDDSAAHRGHAGSQSGAGHFSIIIGSKAFEGQTPIKRHRLVYNALGTLMETDIHALRIKVVEPSD